MVDIHSLTNPKTGLDPRLTHRIVGNSTFGLRIEFQAYTLHSIYNRIRPRAMTRRQDNKHQENHHVNPLEWKIFEVHNSTLHVLIEFDGSDSLQNSRIREFLPLITSNPLDCRTLNQQRTRVILLS